MRVYQFITPTQIGGAELHLVALCRKLAARGHRITAICPRGRPLVGELRRHGIDAWTPRTTGKIDPLTLARLAVRLRRDRVDVLHTHLSTASIVGGLAARLAGVPAVASVHGLNRRTCFNYSPRIIAISEAVRRHLTEQGLPDSRITVIHNGVDLERYRQAPDAGVVRAELGFSADEFVIGAVGRLWPEKGHIYLIEALALAARAGLSARLLIVGEGRRRQMLAQAAGRFGVADRVALVGFQRDVRPYQAAMDICCLPSLKEGLSLSALEAMALGKPVIASRAGGTPEVVVEGETGILVEPASAAALAEAILALARDRPRARRMGEAGRVRVQRHFDLERTVDRIEELYRQVAGSKEQPA